MVTTCPDCRDNKHDACQGDAWDHEADAPAVCECWREKHRCPICQRPSAGWCRQCADAERACGEEW